MTILLYMLAAIRAILLFGFMSIFMLVYGISCLFVPHTKKRALQLRENFLIFVALPILNVRIIKFGQPCAEPGLYVCNHRSFTDPMVICRYLKAFVIAKAEVANYPIINKGAELTGVIWVNRNDQNSRTATRDKMVETIQNGYNVLVFPEGTVGIHKTTLPFKKGTFMEAAENKIPVTPIALEFQSEKDLWIKDKFVPQYLYSYSKWKTEVKIHFGNSLMGDNGEMLQETCQQWINDQLQQMQENWSTAFR